MNTPKLISTTFVSLLLGTLLFAEPVSSSPGIRKIEDITIYRNDDFYSSFPSVVRRPDGELLVAFRRAPNRRKFGGGTYSHSDPNSQLVSVRSKDSGKTWTKEPQLIYSHPLGGAQDPCMVQLTDGSILCTSYGWALLDPKQIANLSPRIFSTKSNYAFLGGFILRSEDGGHSWQAPIIPSAVQGEVNVGIYGEPLPARCRGAMCEGADGRLYWVATASISLAPRRTEVHLMVSEDKGRTWKDSAVVAADPKIEFNETSIYETPKGDLVAFVRSAGMDGRLVVARSTNHGKSFQKWEDTGFHGTPAHAVRLPDDRVLLVYGYRLPPYGVRARVLNAECTDFATAPEVILRDDGGTGDLGYPWATVLSKNRALVTYYFNQADGLRTIESTLVEIQ